MCCWKLMRLGPLAHPVGRTPPLATAPICKFRQDGQKTRSERCTRLLGVGGAMQLQACHAHQRQHVWHRRAPLGQPCDEKCTLLHWGA